MFMHSLLIQDKELKAAADETLGEVRSKVTDVKKALQLMTDLQKLRQVRKEMAEQKGGDDLFYF